MVERVAGLSAELPERAVEVGQRLSREGLKHLILNRMVAELTKRADQCRKLLAL